MFFLEKGNTDCLKGIFAVAILLCHLCGRTGVGSSIGLGPIYTAMGYLSVAIFLVLSGYGLAYSYGQRRGGYLSGFLKNRVLSLYVLQCILIIIYAALKCLLGKDTIQTQDVIQSFLLGKTVVSNGWYLQVILLFYLIFYASYRWFKHPLIIVSISSFVFILLCMAFGLSTTWYESILCFDLGFYIYNYREQLSNIYHSKKKIFIVVSVTWVLFIACFILGTRGIIESYNVKIVFKMISALLFAIGVLFVSNLIPLKGNVTSWLAKYYLEIYFLQGIVFLLCNNRYWHIANPYVYFVVALIGVFTLSKFAHPIINKILGIVKQ